MQPTPVSALEFLSEPRQAIARQMKEHGPMRVEDIALSLGVTVGAVRQHLAGLASEGLVTHDVVRGRPGRPKHVFHLTERGLGLFPRDYGAFATEMLTFFAEEDDALVERFLQLRVEKSLGRVAPDLSSKASLQERVEVVAATLRDDGFMAEAVDSGDGALTLTERNCAVMELAVQDGRICESELEFLRRALPDSTVERLSHMLKDGPICTYRVTPRPPERLAS